MDNELALLMCNLAQVRPGDILLDPFCGTCSILIAGTSLGAYCVGGDFDIKILRGKKDQAGNPVTYVNSFQQYSLNYSDLAWQDINHPGLKAGYFDAIVCDPPYNIRAGTRVENKNSKKNHFGVNCSLQSAKQLYLQLVKVA